MGVQDTDKPLLMQCEGLKHRHNFTVLIILSLLLQTLVIDHQVAPTTILSLIA